MAKVVAISKGYFGGVIREVGDKFEWPDETKLGSWVKPAEFGGKGDHDGDGKPGGSVASADDDKAPADEKPAKGKGKGKGKPETVQAAEAEPFADAPAPATSEPQGNGVKEELGVEPDWIAPGSEAPVMAEE